MSRLLLFGEASLRHALHEYEKPYHQERNPQGKGNVLLLPSSNQRNQGDGPIQDRARLGGLLTYYEREVARVF